MSLHSSLYLFLFFFKLFSLHLSLCLRFLHSLTSLAHCPLSFHPLFPLTGSSTWRSGWKTRCRACLYLFTYIPLRRGPACVFMSWTHSLWRPPRHCGGLPAGSFAFYRRDFSIGVLQLLCCLVSMRELDYFRWHQRNFCLKLFIHAV